MILMDAYQKVGEIYEVLCVLFFGKAVYRCRAAMLDDIKPGAKMLFAGAGHGGDAIYAALSGADVTVIDLSATMLDKFRDNCKKYGAEGIIREIHGDVLEFKENNKFDVVVANFFLNIFDVEMMQKMLKKLVELAKPGAQIVIGDYVYTSRGNLVSRFLKNMYWYMSSITFYIVARHPIHAIYNYPDYLVKIGLTKHEIKYQSINYFLFLKVNFFWSIRAQKPLNQ